MTAQGFLSDAHDKAAEGVDLRQYKYPQLSICTHSAEGKQ